MFKLWDIKYSDIISRDFEFGLITKEQLDSQLPKQYKEAALNRMTVNNWFNSLVEELKITIERYAEGKYALIEDSVNIYYKHDDAGYQSLYVDFIIQIDKERTKTINYIRHNHSITHYIDVDSEFADYFEQYMDKHHRLYSNFAYTMYTHFRISNNMGYYGIGRTCRELYRYER